MQITPSNWKVLVYIAIVISVKYIDDNIIWNSEIINDLALFDLKYTNRYEHFFLGLLDFDVYVQNRLFEEYFRCLVFYKEFINHQSDEDRPDKKESKCFT